MPLLIQSSFLAQTLRNFIAIIVAIRKSGSKITPSMKKKRITKQKKIIEKICFSSSRPLSIDEIESQGKEKLPSLNRVTIYRNLTRMIDAGELTRFSHPEKGTLYEQTNRPHHHHFFCKICEFTFELPGCGLSLKKQTPDGFIVEGDEVFLNGVCKTCAT